ncbi:RNA polymerase sigma factor, partial [Erythrobacter donghaensis]|uniref:RNA polymerase sigma factor n=1 Tax=Erythrobacter donghaensis TaxID=267135 RepID=UPI0018C791BD
MHRYKLPVFSFIRRYVGGNEDAHDLLQQVFIAAWQSLASYDVDRPLGRWLTAIALERFPHVLTRRGFPCGRS